MNGIGAEIFHINESMALVLWLVALLGAGMAVYHIAGVFMLERDKQRLIEAVGGAVASMKGGDFAERLGHHRLRALLYTVAACAVVAFLVI